MYTKLIYSDEKYDFYISYNNQYTARLVIQDKNGKVVLGTERGYIVSGKEVSQKVFKKKAGTYKYYRVTFRAEGVKQEVVLEDIGIVRIVFEDDKYVKNESKLVIRPTKGGLQVRRK